MHSMEQERLVVGGNLDFDPAPHTSPASTSERILVIGGGITGLVTAWVLLDRGYHVTIVSKEWASYGRHQRLTSQIAGALWEYPPAVCGQHTDSISLANSKRWCMVAYEVWAAIAQDPNLAALSGVQMKQSTFYFPCKLEEDQTQLEKMREVEASGVRNFRRSENLIREMKVNQAYGAVDAYQHLAPIIDTDRSMKWLMTLVEGKGAKFVTKTVEGDLFHQEDMLRTTFDADAIVNATGLAGTELASDGSCYPIRGALIRVINDGSKFEKVTSALTIAADAVHDTNEIVFIVPRSENILLLGGIAESHERSLNLTLDSPIIRRMRARCEKFLPMLRDAQIDPDYALAQGLRPFREHNVRVERELRMQSSGLAGRTPSRIVHSYGQGGAGWSLSFGCAEDVATLITQALQDLPAVPMTRPDAGRRFAGIQAVL